jgi:Clustered mitochondria
MALLDFRGYRLICVSLLPIHANTLVYGSSTGGEMVHASDHRLNALMMRAASVIGLKGHLCGKHAQGAAYLHAPVDIEGHRGTDGRYYLLDFARVLPPETPDPAVRGCHLFRQFRPELVQLFVTHTAQPLCSDAHSRFIPSPEDAEAHRCEIAEATEFLHR